MIMNFHLSFDSWQWIRGQENDKYLSGPRQSVNPEDYTHKHLLNERFRDRIVQYILNTQHRKSEQDYFCAQTCNAAMKWLEQNKDNDGPFMLFMDMFDPHEPWDAPPRFQKMYRKKYSFARYIFGYGVNPKDVRAEDIPELIDLYSAISFDFKLPGTTIIYRDPDQFNTYSRLSRLTNRCYTYTVLTIIISDAGYMSGSRL